MRNSGAINSAAGARKARCGGFVWPSVAKCATRPTPAPRPARRSSWRANRSQTCPFGTADWLPRALARFSTQNNRQPRQPQQPNRCNQPALGRSTAALELVERPLQRIGNRRPNRSAAQRCNSSKAGFRHRLPRAPRQRHSTTHETLRCLHSFQVGPQQVWPAWQSTQSTLLP